MSNKKLSSIQWLENNFVKLEHTIGVHGVFYELLEQAKEMHKQEIAEAYWNGSDGIENKNSILKIGIEYYNDTYQL